ncbi:type II toxin-antitoxin system VapC family toxin [Promicromonospora iranensis]|uniref:type II toxin-antitoxin system VapC family toxin n=1 Tax=Promicromonospora iranensis TaxID=1105144 RepID=UPI0023A99B2B|nr:type II toxin-antitoxin system VapC family toxin [Promicromonospora iranensis]
MYVLDTDVVSALRRPDREPAVADRARAIPLADQYVTALTVAEIERGVVRKEQSDPAQGAVLRRWLAERVLPGFAGRVLPFDLSAARILARYAVPEHAPYDDALIAAVAEAHGMTVVTRNVRHFMPLGVRVLCPWEASPGA